MAAKGFTLVEMLVVLAVMALIVALVPPLLSGGQSKAELTAATREIQSALRETRSVAISQGRTSSFVVDVRINAYRRSGDGRIYHVPSGIRLSIFAATDDPDLESSEKSERDDQPGTRAGDEPSIIRFFADGSSTGGGVRLVQGRRRSIILVDWLTGRLSLEAGALHGRG